MPADGELTEVERSLVDHVVRGDLLDLTDSESRSVRASVLRDILRGKLAPDPDPHGLRLKGAQILGRVDLDNIHTEVALELRYCELDEGLTAVDAELTRLVLSGCQLSHPSEPAVDGRRLTATVLDLDEAVVAADCGTGAVWLSRAELGDLRCVGAKLRNTSGHALLMNLLRTERDVNLRAEFEAVGEDEVGAIQLRGARIGGQLNCSGAVMRNGSGPALNAEDLQVGEYVLFGREFVAVGEGEKGAVHLLAARIGGGLDCSGAVLRNGSGPALNAERLQVEQSVFLGEGFHATGAGDDGAIHLSGARIGGQLNCSGAVMRNGSGPALNAENLQVGEYMLFGREFVAVGEGDRGAVHLLDARIGGGLDCSGAVLCNGSGPALSAANLQVEQSVFLRDGFQAAGAGDGGAVRLLRARLGGVLDCSGAVLRNGSGPALSAANLQVEQSVFLRDGFQATGAGDGGAVRLLAAWIGGELSCSGGTMRNESGPALDAEGLQVEQSVFLREEFEATGAGDGGAVRLLAAWIGGVLDCSGAVLRDESGPALNAVDLQVEQNAFLGSGLVAEGAGVSGVVDLWDTRVGGAVQLEPDGLTNTTRPKVLLRLDGLVYSGLPHKVTWREWLELIRTRTPDYAAQPYQQLAGALRAAGHDGEARQVLMAQRRDQIKRRALTGRAERAWARFTGWTLGYGYQPWRALIGLLGVVMLSVVLAIGLGGQGGLATETSAACSVVERVGVGLDMGLPLIKPEGRTGCRITDQAAGQVLIVAGWTLQLLAWAFATLFVAGFTGAVRKT